MSERNARPVSVTVSMQIVVELWVQRDQHDRDCYHTYEKRGRLWSHVATFHHDLLASALRLTDSEAAAVREACEAGEAVRVAEVLNAMSDETRNETASMGPLDDDAEDEGEEGEDDAEHSERRSGEFWRGMGSLAP